MTMSRTTHRLSGFGLCAVWLSTFVWLMNWMSTSENMGMVEAASSYKFTDNYYAGWRPDHVWLQDQGRTINLKLDNTTGSGFRSINSYLHGYVSMKIKLVPRNSAGVVVAYYLTSVRTNTWDEVDFEFLGNVTGEPWILQTNIFCNGTGGREQRIYLWFDPTEKFHTYSILWNTKQIVWYVDAVPIRVYRNKAGITAATYPRAKAMAVYSSIWNGDSWATQGGRVKINWAYQPFIVSYSKFVIDACKWPASPTAPPPPCYTNSSALWWDQPKFWTLSPMERRYYKWAVSRYTVYDYCKDYRRYPTPMPECAISPWD